MMVMRPSELSKLLHFFVIIRHHLSVECKWNYYRNFKGLALKSNC